MDVTARRIGRCRAAFTTLGVLPVTGALTAAGPQVLPPTGTPGLAVNPTSTATTEPSVTPTAAPANAVPGTVVFLTVARSTSGTVPLELTVIADGVRRTSGFGTANGRYLAYSDAEGGLHVVSSDGTGVHRSFARSDWPTAACVPVVGCPVSLSAVSDDGRYVAVGSRRTSPGPRNPPRDVVDLQARRIVDLPDVTGELSAVFFRPDGGMLLYTVDPTGQSSHFYLLGRDPQIARTFPGPSRSIGELVAYIP